MRVLADLSPELLSIACAKIDQAGVSAMVEDIVEADACDLSRWTDDSFDAVLCLGPFYHLPDPNDRNRAAAELGRVLRPEGSAFVALIPRYAFLRRTLAIPDERHHLTQAAFVAGLMEEGVFINDVPGRFTYGYGADPREIAPFLERHGFDMVDLLASEGIAWGIHDALAEMSADDPKCYQVMLDIVFRTADDPSILGASDHLLYVGSKAD